MTKNHVLWRGVGALVCVIGIVIAVVITNVVSRSRSAPTAEDYTAPETTFEFSDESLYQTSNQHIDAAVQTFTPDEKEVKQAESMFDVVPGSVDEPVDTGLRIVTAHTLVDSDYVTEGMSIDDLFGETEEDSTHLDAIVGQFVSSVPIVDVGDKAYLYAYIDPTSENGAGEVVAVDFAENDNFGHVLENIDWDRDSGVARIPRSLFYDDAGGLRNIRAQLLCSINYGTDEGKSMAVESTVDFSLSSEMIGIDVVSPHVQVTTNSFTGELCVPVVSPDQASRVTLDDIVMFADGESAPIDLSNGAEWDAATGMLRLQAIGLAYTSFDIHIAGKDSVSSVIATVLGTDTALALSRESLATWPWGEFSYTRDEWEKLASDSTIGICVEYHAWLYYAWRDYAPTVDYQKRQFSDTMHYLYGASNAGGLGDDSASMSILYKWLAWGHDTVSGVAGHWWDGAHNGLANWETVYDDVKGYINGTVGGSNDVTGGYGYDSPSSGWGYDLPKPWFGISLPSDLGLYELWNSDNDLSWHNDYADAELIEPEHWFDAILSSTGNGYVSNPVPFYDENLGRNVNTRNMVNAALFCCHVSTSVQPTDESDLIQYTAVRMRLLDAYLDPTDNNVGYLIYGFTTGTVAGQSGCGVYKFKVRIEDDEPGKFVVKKIVSGDDSGADASFNFTVTTTPALTGTYGDMTFDNSGKATFSLKHNQKRIAREIPDGTKVVVREGAKSGYTPTWTCNNGGHVDTDASGKKIGATFTVESDKTTTAVCTNKRDKSKLSIDKKLKSDSTQYHDKKFAFRVKIWRDSAKTSLYKNYTFSLSADDDPKVYTVPTGYYYEVTEGNLSAEFTDPVWSNASGRCSTTAGKTVSVTCTNGAEVGAVQLKKICEDTDKVFRFRVTVSKGDDVFYTDVFDLKNGETETISNLPKGYKYEFEEVSGFEGYTPEWDPDKTGTIKVNDTVEVTCENVSHGFLILNKLLNI